MDRTHGARPTVAVAGATGFVGTALRAALAGPCRLRALTRSPVRAEVNASDDEASWRHCDLFSLPAVERALCGVDYAVYLVHSMLPSSRLTQGRCADLDLLLADTFARAAERQGVRQILYIGHLVPKEDPSSLPPQLGSRLEAEQALASGAVPVTVLRAGLILGPGGSALRAVFNLVQRLPVLPLPGGTGAQTQPIARADVIRALRYCLGNEETFGQRYDIGGPEVMSQRDLLRRVARVLGVQRRVVEAPATPSAVTRLGVRLASGAPAAQARLFVESLQYDRVARENPVQAWLQPAALGVEEALRGALGPKGRKLPNPRSDLREEEDAVMRREGVVRSVQRLPLPAGRDADWVARTYLRWLPRYVAPLLRSEVDPAGTCQLYLSFAPLRLLELMPVQEEGSAQWRIFRVTGGLLAEKPSGHQGRLEFREVLERRWVMAALHDFNPALPWYFYSTTQALVHLWVMRGYERYLHAVQEAGAQQDRTPADPRVTTRTRETTRRRVLPFE